MQCPKGHKFMMLPCRDLVPQTTPSEFLGHQVCLGGLLQNLGSSTTMPPLPNTPAPVLTEAGPSHELLGHRWQCQAV